MTTGLTLTLYVVGDEMLQNKVVNGDGIKELIYEDVCNVKSELEAKGSLKTKVQVNGFVVAEYFK